MSKESPLTTEEFIRVMIPFSFSFRFNYLCKFHTIPKLKRMNNKSFLHIMLTLSGDISLNPGPVYNNQLLHSKNGMSLDQKESTKSI